MKQSGWHWRQSVRINRLLLGNSDEPLCSRAYRRDWRLFMFVADIVFGEYGHCRNIYTRWRSRHNQE